MTQPTSDAYVSRGGEKLGALFGDIRVAGAALGSHVGGFVDCLLRRGAARVYSIDTAYGILAWKLRRDARVTVLERTNAMHVYLPEAVGLVTVDVGWTPQSRILPGASRLLAPAGQVVTLIKPHYEASKERLEGGVLADDAVEEVVAGVLDAIKAMGWEVVDTVPSPLRGHGGNREHFALLTRSGGMV